MLSLDLVGSGLDLVGLGCGEQEIVEGEGAVRCARREKINLFMIFINKELVWIKLQDLHSRWLDLSISGINDLPVSCWLNAKTRRLAGSVCLCYYFNYTRWRELLCQLVLRFKLFGWCWLGGFWGFEGLTCGYAGDFAGAWSEKRPRAKAH